jgi:cytochrome P450
MNDPVLHEAFYDPTSPEAHENPYPLYERLRDEYPLYYCEPQGVWVLSRHADVKQGLRDWETFSSAQGVEIGEYVQFFGEGSIQELDPPHHDTVRKVLAARFMNKRVKEYEPMVRTCAEELIAELIRNPTADLGSQFTQSLPILTIFRILGIPDADIDWAMRTGLEMLSRPAGETGPSPRAAQLRSDLVDYMVAQVERRRNPTDGATYADDAFGDIAAGIDAGMMKVSEIQGLALLLIAAGMETTTSLMGNMVHALATGTVTPEQLLNDQGQVSATAIDEFLRFDAPAQWLARVTTRPVELHGIELPVGARVLMSFASANRDPRVFDRADELVLDRDGARNLAFGEGIHFCLGMPLARLEARVGISTLIERAPAFTLAAPPTRYPSHVIRGYETIPVTFGSAPTLAQ